MALPAASNSTTVMILPVAGVFILGTLVDKRSGLEEMLHIVSSLSQQEEGKCKTNMTIHIVIIRILIDVLGLVLCLNLVLALLWLARPTTILELHLCPRQHLMSFVWLVYHLPADTTLPVALYAPHHP